jgi:hypothetical protein
MRRAHLRWVVAEMECRTLLWVQGRQVVPHTRGVVEQVLAGTVVRTLSRRGVGMGCRTLAVESGRM